MPGEPKTVSISPLLSELIKASVSLKPPYAEDSRDARIMHLILDELAILPALPLSLPQPADTRVNRICQALQQDPGDASTVADWSERLGLDQKTIQLQGNVDNLLPHRNALQGQQQACLLAPLAEGHAGFFAKQALDGFLVQAQAQQQAQAPFGDGVVPQFGVLSLKRRIQ